MIKKHKNIFVILVLVLVVVGSFSYYYLTKPNLRFTNTRENEADYGPQYVKVKTDGKEFTQISGNIKTGTNIESEIDKVNSKVVDTYEIDEQLKAELEKGQFNFDNPGVFLNPYQNSPLSAVVLFKEEVDKIRVVVKGKTEENDIVNTIEGANENIIPIIGLYPDYNNQVSIEKLDSEGNTIASKTIYIQTDVLPDTLRNNVSVEKKTVTAAFELIMISGLDAPYLYALDSSGEIRWYSTMETEYYGAYPLENGHFLMEASRVMMPTSSSPHSSKFQEVDYLGRVYKDYYIPTGAHHDIQEMKPNGNFLIITDSGDGYEQDAIMEIDRQTGELVKELDLKTLMENTGYVDSDDWAHINTCSYNNETNSILISVRNLHSAIKIDWQTNEIVWILSNPSFWENTEYKDKVLMPEGDIQWHYQQHSVYEIAEDIDGDANTIHIMLYDNHNDANRPVNFYDSTNSSYVKLYTINEVNKTVKQEKQYESAYSKITSNFILDYNRKRVFAVSATINEDNTHGRIYEYDYDSGEVLNQYSITHRFYRGYSIKIDTSSCMQEIDLNSNYYVGELRTPVEIKENVTTPFRTLKPNSNVNLSMGLTGDLLLVTARNLSYTQLIFKGEDSTFIYDISDIKCKLENGYTYAIAIPLTEMKADSYTVYGMFEDEYFKTGYGFTIH